MHYANIGRSGLRVSRICLGMMSYGSPTWRDWILDEKQSIPFIEKALELGINFFDTANAYSNGVSEEITGRTLKKLAKRDEYVLATKVFFDYGDKPNQGGLSKKAIIYAVEDSLRKLDLDYIDLYQIHRWDYNTPIDETMEALHDLVKSGKVRYIGASSMFAWQFSKAQYMADLRGWSRFISMQNHYNLIYREEEREMNPLCLDQEVGLLPWSPLARGLLTGNRTKEDPGKTIRAKSDEYGRELYKQDADFEIVARVVEMAKQKEVSPAQIALAWLLHKPGVVSPIIGATKINHLEEAVAALDIEMSTDDIGSLEELYQPHPVLGHS